MNGHKRRTTQQRGFTITQMVITIAIISLVSAFGVLGIRNARAEFRLQNNARLFATYVEKSRVDAIRRHAPGGSESSIETFGPGTSNYAVTMDFGSGVVETRTFNLESGLSFSTAAKKVSFNWRGRIAEAWVFQIFSNYLSRSLPVDVSGSGDITVGEQHFPDQLIPPVEISEVTGDVQPIPTPTPAIGASPSPEVNPSASPTPTPTPTPTPSPSPNNNGNGNGNNGNNGNGNNGNGNPTPSPTPTVTPSPSASPSPSPAPIPQCVATISPDHLSLSQSDASKSSGSATFAIQNATGVRTISAVQSGNGNSLTIALSIQRLDGSGSSVVTVTKKNGAGNRGVFEVDISTSPACGSTQKLTVSVSN